MKTLFVLAALWAVTLAADFGGDWRRDWAGVHDSLRDIEPWLRPRWLVARGLSVYYAKNSWKPAADSGLACIGRWSYGPSARVSLRVTGTDTIICLTRGSGASLIRFRSQDSLTLDLLSDIDCSGITSRAILQDTLVFCGMWQGGTGIEVWGAGNLQSPHRLSYVYLPPVKDIAVRDTLLYAVSFQGDSLRVFNVADPRSPVQVGACANPGIYMYGIQVSGDYCYMADQNGLFIVDVSIPQSPHIAGTIGGFDAFAVAVRDTLCYLGTQSSSTFALKVYNVKDPATPFPVGSLTGIEAHDLYLPPTCDTVIYTPKLHVINIANPASPRQIGFVDCPGWDYGVTAVPALNCVLVADYFKGMVAVNVTNPTAPALDTMAFAGHEAVDISIDNDKAYLASYHAGLQILDVSNPSRPSYLGCYDTAGASKNVSSATARDSFAFASWNAPRMLIIDVTDPRYPVRVRGWDSVPTLPEDMILRDTFLYIAGRLRFGVVNVARPREPTLVGSCVLSGDARGVDLEDTVAYVGMGSGGLACINVANPNVPTVIGTWSGRTSGVGVKDSLAFVTGPYTGCVCLSVTNPAAPYVLDSLYLEQWWNDVAVADSLVFVGGTWIHVVDASDPRNLRVVGTWTPPYLVRRLEYHAPYLYAACYEAGVCILETVQVGVGEELSSARLVQLPGMLCPNPASKYTTLRAGPGLESSVMRDVLGRMVRTFKPSGTVFTMDLAGLRPGLYFIELRYSTGRRVEKLIKR